MRVLVLSPFGTAVNPYIGLFEKGLRLAGAAVTMASRLAASDLEPGVRPDVVHLHWLERYDPPPFAKPQLFPMPLQGVERIALRAFNSGPIYQLRRWQRLNRLLDQLAAFQRSGGCVAYTVHNLDPHEAGGWAEPRAVERLTRSADVLHVHDVSTQGEITRRYGELRGIAVIPHGHYLDAYPNTVTRDAARRQMGLPQNAFVYVCLGLMRPYKGLEDLLPAFNKLGGDDLRLVVAGRPPDDVYVQRLRGLAAGDPRVRLDPRFIPPEEVQVYLNAADVAVLPYRQITTSGAALLAFSFGLPVVAPGIGAFPNLVTPERGVLYTPGQLSAALEQARRTDWSDARARIIGWVGQYDWAEIGRRLVEAYSTAAARRAAMD